MRISDRFTKERFRHGEDGPAYLVPDEATRERLERQQKTTGVVTAE